ncbi:MAG: tRNA pseudouridine(55) synthase TruB [Flavobacteriales bacterium]|nr:tRNA pseudouridine(55) synthase TruB [Flavobacteriales bacterium]
MEKPDQQTAFGHTLLIDKPIEWTSFDVVNKLRYAAKRITGRKRIKVGHAGTLDPLATGLVLVCVGKDTKTIHGLMGLSKQYTGTMRLGATTPSYDLETAEDGSFPLPENDPAAIQSIASTFVGDIDQMPPAFSAKKVDGIKAYKLARKGKEVNLKAARIHIERFDVNCDLFPDLSFVLDCSKGTYVRSLAHDLGKALGSGAHLTSLRRTQIGDFSIGEAHTIESAMTALEEAFTLHEHSDSEKRI